MVDHLYGSVHDCADSPAAKIPFDNTRKHISCPPNGSWYGSKAKFFCWRLSGRAGTVPLRPAVSRRPCWRALARVQTSKKSKKYAKNISKNFAPKQIHDEWSMMINRRVFALSRFVSHMYFSSRGALPRRTDSLTKNFFIIIFFSGLLEFRQQKTFSSLEATTELFRGWNLPAFESVLCGLLMLMQHENFLVSWWRLKRRLLGGS